MVNELNENNNSVCFKIQHSTKQHRVKSAETHHSWCYVIIHAISISYSNCWFLNSLSATDYMFDLSHVLMGIHNLLFKMLNINHVSYMCSSFISLFFCAVSVPFNIFEFDYIDWWEIVILPHVYRSCIRDKILWMNGVNCLNEACSYYEEPGNYCEFETRDFNLVLFAIRTAV
jgi:hypothetical protein